MAEPPKQEVPVLMAEGNYFDPHCSTYEPGASPQRSLVLQRAVHALHITGEY